MARCLFDLNRAVEADKVLKNFQQKFPEYASNSSCKALKMDIKEAIDSGIIFGITSPSYHFKKEQHLKF